MRRIAISYVGRYTYTCASSGGLRCFFVLPPPRARDRAKRKRTGRSFTLVLLSAAHRLIFLFSRVAAAAGLWRLMVWQGAGGF